jgi:hypothetical protein
MLVFGPVARINPHPFLHAQLNAVKKETSISRRQLSKQNAPETTQLCAAQGGSQHSLALGGDAGVVEANG